MDSDSEKITSEYKLELFKCVLLSISRTCITAEIAKPAEPVFADGQSRPLDPVYPFIFMDAIHYKIREDGRIINRAAYVVLGGTLDGNKDILSITIGANESSKFWLGMLNDLKNRGVKEVLFFCVDGLTGFKEAINAVYPDAEVP